MAATLSERLTSVLRADFDFTCVAPSGSGGLSGSAGDEVQAMLAADPVDRRDRFLTLLTIYDLLTAPLERIGAQSRWATHPAVAGVKLRLETAWLSELDAASQSRIGVEDPVSAIRSIAAKDRLPDVYKWVAERASLDELRRFLAVEGGPDGGFDDLVAICQVGLSGAPKMELARNYWDEMGNGDPDEVHTEVHREMVTAIELPEIARGELPVEALERSALGGLLATNRWLQPEMVGALGLTELQAGPRCRLVLNGFRRLGVSRAAHPFYAIHADVDPKHGKDWLEQAVAPLAAERPDWRARMVRGAMWRWHVNAGLFDSYDFGQQVAAAA